jgi:hypothetical protein
MDQFFGITELFEQVLLQLPIKDLLLNAQRVSKAWRNTVKRSTSLQRALFLAPDIDDNHSTNRSLIQLNPFGDLISIKEHTNRTAAFDYSEASWRRMLILQPPVPMRLYQDCRTMRFSYFTLGTTLETTSHLFTGLTFGDVEQAMQGRRMNVIVETDDIVYWRTAAFEHEVDQLHWTTA